MHLVRLLLDRDCEEKLEEEHRSLQALHFVPVEVAEPGPQGFSVPFRAAFHLLLKRFRRCPLSFFFFCVCVCVL